MFGRLTLVLLTLGCLVSCTIGESSFLVIILQLDGSCVQVQMLENV